MISNLLVHLCHFILGSEIADRRVGNVLSEYVWEVEPDSVKMNKISACREMNKKEASSIPNNCKLVV